MLVSPAGTLTCPGSEVTSSWPAKSPALHLPLLTSLPPAVHSTVAVPAPSGACTGPCSQSQGHWPLSIVLSRIDCLAQTAPGLVDQRLSHRLGKGQSGNQARGSRVSTYGTAPGSRVRSTWDGISTPRLGFGSGSRSGHTGWAGTHRARPQARHLQLCTPSGKQEAVASSRC